MKYIAYRGTKYEYKTTIPEKRKFEGKQYSLAEVFPNYGSFKGHKEALAYARQIREYGGKARVIAHSGFSVVYGRGRYM